MKIGLRTPSIKRSISARTTGKYKRKFKRMVNPFYGKKGMGWIRNPKKALYNKIYHKTSFSMRDVMKGSSNIFYILIILPIKWMFILAWIILKWTFIVAAFVTVWLFVTLYNVIVGVVEKTVNVGREDYPTDDNGTYEVDRIDYIETKQNNG